MTTRAAGQPLPRGLWLDDVYRLDGVLASGGFSYVYFAEDIVGAPVAIKEYFPATLARRAADGLSLAAAGHHANSFQQGLRCFFEEGRALAGLRHPNVVRVLNFFRANGTAYMAMRYEQGDTLQAHIEKRAAEPQESWLRQTFLPLLHGLREVHARKLLHLDIKPGNVYLRADGEPMLIDFGATRRALGAESPGLPAVYSTGFASPEHLGDRARLGPWSDIYSIGACLYACLAAETPPPAHERLAKDRLLPAARRWARRYSERLLQAIDWCLRLDPLGRPQSVLELQKALAA